MDTALPKLELARRTNRLAAWVGTRGAKAVLITSPHAIHYYSGFETTGYYLPHAMLAVGGDLHLLVRDFEEGNDFAGNTKLHLWDTRRPFEAALKGLIATACGHSCDMLYEDSSNFLQPHVLQALAAVTPELRLVPAGRDIHALRAVKSETELWHSRAAGEIAASGLRAGLGSLTPGATERGVSMTMLGEMISKGGEFPASLPYVYFGAKSWRRMQQPGIGRLTPDQPFYLECGGSAARYAAATLRSGFYGRCPLDYRDLYAAALEGFLTVEAAIRPGVRSAELDAIGSSAIANAGFSELRLSKFGYSIGIAFSPGWGEASAFDIDPHSDAQLAESMVIHLVSTLMSPAWGTVGLSETVEVTRNGCVSLTPASREFIELV